MTEIDMQSIFHAVTALNVSVQGWLFQIGILITGLLMALYSDRKRKG